jgi:hypothetical protein
MMVILPMPLLAINSAAKDPTPPNPTTITCCVVRYLSFSSPISSSVLESQDVSKVAAVAGELGKHLSIEKLTEGLRFVVIQRQKGGEAAAKAIDEYAARPDLNEFEKIAAQNLKAGLSIAQRDDVRGLIAGAIFFACESKLGAHRGGFLAVPIISILFPELNEKHDYKP